MNTCEHCQINFERHNSPFKRFCSYACKNKAQARGDKRSTFVCKQCGKSFETWTYRRPDYCSVKCGNIYKAGLPKQRKTAAYLYVIQPCKNCGKPHKFNRHQIRLRGGKYCSQECKYAAFSIERRGAGNPNYTGGPPADRGPNWPSQSRKARRRDNYTCQICGKKYTKGTKVRTDVHHITPYRYFNGDFKKANDLSNLIVLCRDCHCKVERGKIPCPHRLPLRV